MTFKRKLSQFGTISKMLTGHQANIKYGTDDLTFPAATPNSIIQCELDARGYTIRESHLPDAAKQAIYLTDLHGITSSSHNETIRALLNYREYEK